MGLLLGNHILKYVPSLTRPVVYFLVLVTFLPCRTGNSGRIFFPVVFVGVFVSFTVPGSALMKDFPAGRGADFANPMIITRIYIGVYINSKPPCRRNSWPIQ